MTTQFQTLKLELNEILQFQRTENFVKILCSIPISKLEIDLPNKYSIILVV